MSSVPTGGARPLLIDTDVAPDDLVAIAFLLASPTVEIKAITVSGTGDQGFLGEFDRDDPGADIKAQVGRWRDFVDAGLHVASATDAPWTFPDDLVLKDDMGRPVDQIAAGMDGRVRTRPATPPWLLDQLLTAEQGVQAVTLDAAYALGDEARRGHLAPGKLADITILSGDVTAATPDEIRTMSVIATIVGGIPAYCADPETCSKLKK